MEELLQQMKQSMESQMNCEVEITGPSQLSISIETDGDTHTYTVNVSED